ncbi:MAG: hypothetical protein KGL29_02835 [Alphaproteobacteria bacterium]|nr:hypothetical protein [Alphaproteobacteria bacterium]MDE2264811.1 hypothetical protein [Alphaproteobacteria bacterium]
MSQDRGLQGVLITVAAFREPWEAHMFCARLMAEGVPATIIHEYHIGNAWHSSVALGGVKVQVPDARKEEAEAVERLCRSGKFKSLLQSEFGDLDDVRCPHCGSGEYRKRRPLLRAAAAIAVSFTFMILPPLGWVYFCEKCGTKFMRPFCPMTAGRWLTVLTAIAGDLIFLSGLVLCFWILTGTKYWFVVAVVTVMFAAQWGVRRLSSSNNIPD